MYMIYACQLQLLKYLVQKSKTKNMGQITAFFKDDVAMSTAICEDFISSQTPNKAHLMFQLFLYNSAITLKCHS